MRECCWLARRIKAASRRSEDSVEASELGIVNESTKMIGAAGYSNSADLTRKELGQEGEREKREGKANSCIYY